MSIELLIFTAIILVGFVSIIYFFNRKISQLQNSRTDIALLEWLKTMQTSMDSHSLNMNRVLQENEKQLHERLDKAAETMRDVNKEVGKMTEIGSNMQELQDFLKSPKLRGNIGKS